MDTTMHRSLTSFSITDAFCLMLRYIMWRNFHAMVLTSEGKGELKKESALQRSSLEWPLSSSSSIALHGNAHSIFRSYPLLAPSAVKSNDQTYP
jgi:hypothetical protein